MATYSISRLVIFTNKFSSPSQIKRDTFGRRSCSSAFSTQVLKKQNDFQGKIESMAREKMFKTMALHFGDGYPSIHGREEVDGGEIEGLKEEVKIMLTDSTNNTIGKIIALIDTLECLGLSYHFEEEIKKQIDRIFKANMEDYLESMEDLDLHTMSLLFRISRQRGVNIFPGVFNKFKDGNGELDKSYAYDFKGLLSLYQATHLRKQGEEFLEKSAAFTKTILLKMMPYLNPSFQIQVGQALEESIFGGCLRAKIRDNISIYEMDKNRNGDLLKLAKLDYNYMQSIHKEELVHVRRWWKNLNLSKLYYSLDIVIESYYAAIGPHFEPRHSLSRIMATKSFIINAIIDQTFDCYGCINDLEIFEDQILGWNVEEVYRLPSFMKIVYATLLNIHDEYLEALKKQGREFEAEFAKEWWMELAMSYFTKAKWFSEGYVPKFDEYMENAMISNSCFLLIPTLLLGIESTKVELFEYLKENPDIVKLIAKIGRLIYDMTTYEVENGRGQFVNGIQCYMEEYGVSKEEAFKKFHEMAEHARMELNEELLSKNSASTPMEIEMITHNKVSLVDGENGFMINPKKFLKSQIVSVLVDHV